LANLHIVRIVVVHTSADHEIPGSEEVATVLCERADGCRRQKNACRNENSVESGRAGLTEYSVRIHDRPPSETEIFLVIDD